MNKVFEWIRVALKQTKVVVGSMIGLFMSVGIILILCDIFFKTSFGVLQQIIDAAAKLNIKGDILTFMVAILTVGVVVNWQKK